MAQLRSGNGAALPVRRRRGFNIEGKTASLCFLYVLALLDMRYSGYQSISGLRVTIAVWCQLDQTGSLPLSPCSPQETKEPS